MKEAMAVGLFCAALALALEFIMGCGAQAAQQDAVRASYAADLQLCVADASTRDGAEECRKNVDKRYGVDAGLGGAR